MFDLAQSGVFSASPADLAELAGIAQTAGLDVIDVDLASARDRAGLYDAFTVAFGFPAGFGRNLDALADSLADLSWRPAVGYFVRLRGCATALAHCPADAEAILDVLGDVATEWRDRGQPCLIALDHPHAGIDARPVRASKRPQSVLVLIHSPQNDILLIERTRHPGFWQSVTGSIEGSESPERAAQREVAEETGIVAPGQAIERWHHSRRFEIFPIWRDRYPPGVTHNTEHLFSLCIARDTPVRLAPAEHRAWRWLPWRQALDSVFSWTNRDAIRMLIQRKPVHPSKA
jgi:dATP pyrophosphohydrolase